MQLLDPGGEIYNGIESSLFRAWWHFLLIRCVFICLLWEGMGALGVSRQT